MTSHDAVSTLEPDAADPADPPDFAEAAGPPETPDASTRPRRWRRWLRFNYLGLVGGVLAVGMSLTPSLLPRPWVFEGIIAGFGLTIGYGIGCLVSFLVRRLVPIEPAAAVKRLPGAGWLWLARCCLWPA